MNVFHNYVDSYHFIPVHNPVKIKSLPTPTHIPAYVPYPHIEPCISPTHENSYRTGMCVCEYKGLCKTQEQMACFAFRNSLSEKSGSTHVRAQLTCTTNTCASNTELTHAQLTRMCNSYMHTQCTVHTCPVSCPHTYLNTPTWCSSFCFCSKSYILRFIKRVDSPT